MRKRKLVLYYNPVPLGVWPSWSSTRRSGLKKSKAHTKQTRQRSISNESNEKALIVDRKRGAWDARREQKAGEQIHTNRKGVSVRDFWILRSCLTLRPSDHWENLKYSSGETRKRNKSSSGPPVMPLGATDTKRRLCGPSSAACLSFCRRSIHGRHNSRSDNTAAAAAANSFLP